MLIPPKRDSFQPASKGSYANGQQDSPIDCTRLENLARTNRQRQSERAVKALNELDAMHDISAAWGKIYVCGPPVGQPIDYRRWRDNIMEFALSAQSKGYLDKLLDIDPQILNEDEKRALSLIRAGSEGGESAVEDRILQLDSESDDRAWKEVFRHDVLLAKAMWPERFSGVTAPTSDTRSEQSDEKTDADGNARSEELTGDSQTRKKRKRSTAKGEATTKLLAELLVHHKYSEGSCLNFEPIGCNELAEKAEVGSGSATRFFQKEFNSHARYLAICKNRDRQRELTNKLKELEGGFAPRPTSRTNPPAKGPSDRRRGRTGRNIYDPDTYEDDRESEDENFCSSDEDDPEGKE